MQLYLLAFMEFLNCIKPVDIVYAYKMVKYVEVRPSTLILIQANLYVYNSLHFM